MFVNGKKCAPGAFQTTGVDLRFEPFQLIMTEI